MTEDHNGQTIMKRESWNRKLETAGWGLFFLWTGIAFLTHIGWGVGFLGVGLIILGGQIARKYLGLRWGEFWGVVGSLFIIAGIWDLFRVQMRLLPILCLIAGVALLASFFIGRGRNSRLADRC